MATKKRYALGLDVSTSCTGICVVDRDIQPDSIGSHIILLDHESFKKCKTMWDKADALALKLGALAANNKSQADFTVFIEEALLGFRPGLSSATTIASLLRFNGIVAYIARNIFSVEPQFVSAAHARKTCGIKLQRTSVAGKSQKEQVFDHMAQGELKHVVWPTKKSMKVVDWSRDVTDAYVIARAGSLLNK